MTNLTDNRVLFGLSAIATVIFVVFAASLASACDEPEPIILKTENIHLEVEDYGVNKAVARDWAQWMMRMEYMLPDGYSVRGYMWDKVELCRADQCTKVTDDFGDDLSVLYEALAIKLRAPEKSVDWLAQREFPIWTVQVGATPFYEGALELGGKVGNHGAVSISHYDGDGTILADDTGGEFRYLVLAGVFTSRKDAKATQADLAETGVKSFVRKL